MKISVVMPVCAWPQPADLSGMPHHHLCAALQSIVNAGHGEVEILIGSDGVVPKIKEAVANWSAAINGAHPPIHYFEFPFTGKWDNTQRNRLLQEATGEIICFQDQDDEFFPNALADVCRVALENPGRPLIFRHAAYQTGTFGAPRKEPWILWMKQGAMAKGEIDGHMFVIPNNKQLFGVWHEDAYEGDWYFMIETLQKYAATGIHPCWRGEFISITRPWAAS